MRLYPSSEFLCDKVEITFVEHEKFADNWKNPKY